jgi:hypothetical protein
MGRCAVPRPLAVLHGGSTGTPAPDAGRIAGT